MLIPPKYTVNQEILELISRIEVLRLHFSSLKLVPQINEKIQRVSLLKSSLFSARIEGNPLELSGINYGDKQKKLEIFNIIDASKLIYSNTTDSISKDLLLKIHACVLKNTSPEAGMFRKDPSAIFNLAGVAVYITPSPLKIHTLLDNLLAYINSNTKEFPIVTSLIVHLIFEKIHPFLDGNGRVGRLLLKAVLKTKGWAMFFNVPFEEYLDKHKDEYYFHLDQGFENTNGYLIFMLEAFLKQLEETKEQIEQESAQDKHYFLPPRQEEIMLIIKDHIVISFNSIKRRFLKVPERTLRYDLKKLADKGLIETTGETRGRYYRWAVRSSNPRHRQRQ